MIERRHFFEIGCAAVFYNFNAAEINTRLACRVANLFLITEQGNMRQTIAHAGGRGDDRPRIFSFRQHDMLWVGGGALADAFEHVHISSLESGVWGLKAD